MIKALQINASTNIQNNKQQEENEKEYKVLVCSGYTRARRYKKEIYCVKILTFLAFDSILKSEKFANGKTGYTTAIKLAYWTKVTR